LISLYIEPVKCSTPVWLFAVVTFVAAASSCTRPNPDFCCSSEAECAALGVDQLRTCGDGHVCDSNVCAKAECSTSETCTDLAAPYCVNQVCKASCSGDGDCVGAAGGPLCADDGVCVGCESNKDCTASAPICSPTQRACTACRADADCESGVCLAADGVCALATELIYVREDGTDGSACPKSAPCRTFTGALARVSPTRRVIRLLGTQYETADGIVLDSKDIYLDAESTQVRRISPGRIITVSGTSKLTIEGIKLDMSLGQTGIESTSTQLVRLSQIDATGGGAYAVFTNAGTLHIRDSKFVGALVLCGMSTMDIHTCDFRNASIEGGSDCVTHVSRSSFTDTQLAAGGVLRAENNVIVSNSATCTNDFYASITEIHFNTWICRHTPPVSEPFKGTAFYCGGSDSVSFGNLLAWDSTNPAPSCTLSHSIIPSFATVAGANHVVAAAASIFVDFLGGDYHLRADSPAKGAAESNSGITVDFDGAPRPNPKGSAPDIGAFEAP
jgi:hypothetical protein